MGCELEKAGNSTSLRKHEHLGIDLLVVDERIQPHFPAIVYPSAALAEAGVGFSVIPNLPLRGQGQAVHGSEFAELLGKLLPPDSALCFQCRARTRTHPRSNNERILSATCRNVSGSKYR